MQSYVTTILYSVSTFEFLLPTFLIVPHNLPLSPASAPNCQRILLLLKDYCF